MRQPRLRPGELPPRQLFPIAAKYAVVTAVLLVVFLWIVVQSVLGVSREKVDTAINRTGVMAASFARQLDIYWAGPGGLTSDQLEKLEESLRRKAADSPEILDIIILDRLENMLANAIGARSATITKFGTEVRSAAAERAGVTIRSGKLNGRRTRSYECPIVYQGSDVAFVIVFLSADSIDELEDQLTSGAIRNVFLALLVGIPIVLLAGWILTGPIRILKRDMETVAEGDLDHQSSVRTSDELGSLAAAFNRMTHQLADAQEAELRQLSLERDLSIANRIQGSLLPDSVPELTGYELGVHYVSAKEVGGDYYDFIPLEGGRIGIVVADVSGKGIPGSLVMTMTRSLVRMAAHAHPRVSDVLARVNENLSRDMTRGMFVTLIYFDFTPETGKLSVGRAGHNPAYLFQAARGSIGQIQPSGIALGMDKGPLFEESLKVGTFSLEVGDFLVLYTDGVVEAMDVAGNEYTTERFVAVLEAVREYDAQTIVETIVADLAEHTAGADPSDDVTLVILKRVSAGEGEATEPGSGELPLAPDAEDSGP